MSHDLMMNATIEVDRMTIGVLLGFVDLESIAFMCVGLHGPYPSLAAWWHLVNAYADGYQPLADYRLEDYRHVLERVAPRFAGDEVMGPSAPSIVRGNPSGPDVVKGLL